MRVSAGWRGAIDCGTNSTRLLVVDPDGLAHRRRMVVTRLGAGLAESGRLDPVAIERTVAVLAEFRRDLDADGVETWRAVATAAAREAENGGEFQAAAAAVLGRPLEVLSPAEEGQLAFRGAAGAAPAGATAVVVDVGGGSSELISGRDGVVRHLVSLPMGCVRLTESFLRHDPPEAAEVAAARRRAEELVAGAVAAEPGFREAEVVIGVAGTVSALATLAAGLRHYDRDRVDGQHLTAEAIEEWLGRLGGISAAERVARFGLEPGRADVLVGGAIAVSAVLKGLGAGELIVSESDILDGVAASVQGVT